MSRTPKPPDPKRAAAIRAGLARRRARGGKLGRSFQYTPEQAAEVVELREEGLSWSGISASMSIPISSARNLYLRGVADLSQTPVSNLPQTSAADMLKTSGGSLLRGVLDLSQTPVSVMPDSGVDPMGPSPSTLSSRSTVSSEESATAAKGKYETYSEALFEVDSVAGLTASGEALLSMLVAHEPRLGLSANLARSRHLLAMMLDLPPSDASEDVLPECPDPRQRVWTLAEINVVRGLLSDGMAQLKIAKTVNASPNDISAIKQERIDRVRGGYIVHRTKAKMKRYRASLSR